MTSKLRTAWAVPVLLLVALLALGGCRLGSSLSSADSDAGSTSAMSSRADRETAQDDAAPTDSAKQSAGSDKRATTVAALSRAVISTGQISIRSDNLGRARSEVMGLVSGWQGIVADEQTDSNEHGRMIDSSLTLRVPTPRFSEAMTALGRVGQVQHQSRKSEDVTTQVLDNAARVRAAERSIKQIELLLGRATELGDIITIESDLARRQADLDSLKSQQAWLDDQTSLSTITVFLTTGTPAGEDEVRGFLAGLGQGWKALTASTVVLLTAAGAVLPFALLVLVLGAPLWVLIRRRRSVAPAVVPAPTES